MRAETHRSITTKRLSPTFAGSRWSLPPGGWVACAAGAWSLAYAGLGLSWAFGGGFPFGPNDADAGDMSSLLAGLDAGIGGPAIAGLGVVGEMIADGGSTSPTGVWTHPRC